MKKFITVVFVAMLTVVAFSQQRYTYSTKTLELQGAAPRLYLNGTGASINFYNGDITLTQSTNLLTLAGGNLSLGTNSLLMTGSLGSSGSPLTKGWMTEIQATTAIVNTTINPDANDGATLGQSGTAFSDLFLASGAVIDFDAGDFTIAHTNSQYVTVTGDLGIAGRLDLSNGGTIETTGGNIDNTELYSLNGVTGSLAYSTENYGSTGTGDIVLSTGATMTDVTVTGADIYYTPLSTGTITDATGITAAMLSRFMYYSEAAATDITADPQIANGTSGQIITIIGSSDTNTLTLDDSTGLRLSAQCVLGIGDNITLFYEGTIGDWIEISRSNN